MHGYRLITIIILVTNIYNVIIFVMSYYLLIVRTLLLFALFIIELLNFRIHGQCMTLNKPTIRYSHV